MIIDTEINSETKRMMITEMPATFLDQEERNNFTVTEGRKAIWAVLLDLLLKFQHMCEKHGLRYFAICGTALGAMRHNGFIPWDDDLDIAMPRKDYEKLKTLRNEFEAPYSLVWPETERENGYSFLKLRNSDTTGLSKAFSNLNINHGLFIDIFPLDEVKSLEKYEDEQARIKNLLIENSNRMKGISNGSIARTKDEIGRMISTYNDIEALAAMDNGLGGEYLALRTISFYPASKMIWNKSVFEEAIDVPFEFMSIKAPIGWRTLLETNYGKWHEFPPIEQRGTWHSNVIFDASKPYEFYTKAVK